MQQLKSAMHQANINKQQIIGNHWKHWRQNMSELSSMHRLYNIVSILCRLPSVPASWRSFAFAVRLSQSCTCQGIQGPLGTQCQSMPTSIIYRKRPMMATFLLARSSSLVLPSSWSGSAILAQTLNLQKCQKQLHQQLPTAGVERKVLFQDMLFLTKRDSGGVLKGDQLELQISQSASGNYPCGWQ